MAEKILTVAEQIEKKKLELMTAEREMQELQLETLRENVSQIRTKKARRKSSSAANELALRTKRERDLADQENCAHRKAGKNEAGFRNGNSGDHSVIKNTYPWGATEISCTRCGKIVSKPSQKLKKSNLAEYKERLAEFNAWLKMPTDNEPSGSQLFGIAGAEALTDTAMFV